jgi:hypothetical protein
MIGLSRLLKMQPKYHCIRLPLSRSLKRADSLLVIQAVTPINLGNLMRS